MVSRTAVRALGAETDLLGPLPDIGSKSDMYLDWNPPDKDLKKAAKDGSDGVLYGDDEEERRLFNKILPTVGNDAGRAWETVKSKLDKQYAGDINYWKRIFNQLLENGEIDAAEFPDFQQRMRSVGAPENVVKQITFPSESKTSDINTYRQDKDTPAKDDWRMNYQEFEPG